MSYRCATFGLESIGIPTNPTPRISCDAPGCEARIEIGANGRRPPAWFLDGKAAPKWKKKGEGTTRVDLCQFHKHLIDSVEPKR